MQALHELQAQSIDSSKQRIWGCNMDLPIPGTYTPLDAFEIAGWVVGRSSPAVAVEVLIDGKALRQADVASRRPDIALAFPRIPEAERSGFQIMVPFLEVEPEFTVAVQAVFEDGSRLHVGEIQGQADSLRLKIEI
jgi:hypothetical protein